jgi:hypothetical protein
MVCQRFVQPGGFAAARIYRNRRFEFGKCASANGNCCWPPRTRLSPFHMCSKCGREMRRSAGSIWNDCAAGIDKEAEPISRFGRGPLSRHAAAARHVEIGPARHLTKRTFCGGGIGLPAQADRPLHHPAGRAVPFPLRAASTRSKLFAGSLEHRTTRPLCEAHAELAGSMFRKPCRL